MDVLQTFKRNVMNSKCHRYNVFWSRFRQTCQGVCRWSHYFLSKSQVWIVFIRYFIAGTFAAFVAWMVSPTISIKVLAGVMAQSSIHSCCQWFLWSSSLLTDNRQRRCCLFQFERVVLIGVTVHHLVNLQHTDGSTVIISEWRGIVSHPVQILSQR